MEFPDRFKIDYDDVISRFKLAQRQEVDGARTVARLLGQALRTQTQEDEKNPGFEIYFKDIDSLDHYLTFLRTNGRKAADGSPLAVMIGKGTNQETVPAGKEAMYTKIGDNWAVYTSDFIASLNALKPISDQPGNAVMKPALKRLIEDFNQASGQKVDTAPGSTTPGTDTAGGASSDAKPTGLVKPIGLDAEHRQVYEGDDGRQWLSQKGKDGKDHLVLYNGGTGAASSSDNASASGKDVGTAGISLVMRALPFDTASGELSPMRMTQFISIVVDNLKQYGTLAKYPEAMQTIMLAQTNMTKTWQEWNSLISNVASQAQGQHLNSNVSSFSASVPFALGNSPTEQLVDAFGSRPNAATAAKILKQMIQLVSQTVYGLMQLPFYGAYKESLNGQRSQAQTYDNALNVLTR